MLGKAQAAVESAPLREERVRGTVAAVEAAATKRTGGTLPNSAVPARRTPPSASPLIIHTSAY